ncbi:MAG: FkbM family methyltransferase [Bacteroidota bacterium]
MIRKWLNIQLYQKVHSRALFGLFGTVIKELRVSPVQFLSWNPLSVIRTSWLMILSISKLTSGRSRRISYSFTGEDMIMSSLLKKSITDNGFYVDVGCNHPIHLSNSYSFYRLGWRGICIDANRELIKKYKWYRPRDKAIFSLVSNSQEQLLYYHLTNDVLSTVNRQNLESFLSQGQKIVKKELIQPQSLNSILKKADCPEEFDFLSIDVENHDWSVIQSIDLNLFKPKLIIIELDPERYLIEFLTKYGYVLKGSVLKNSYFWRE